MDLRPSTARVSRRLEIGSRGEAIAISFLKKNSLHILAQNYRFGRREIDIIAQDKDTICFIEVKTRTSQEYGLPQEAITAKKRRRLTTLALNYIKRYALDNYNFRFDVVSILWDKSKKEPAIEYIKDAFAVDERWSV